MEICKTFNQHPYWDWELAKRNDGDGLVLNPYFERGDDNDVEK